MSSTTEGTSIDVVVFWFSFVRSASRSVIPEAIVTIPKAIATPRIIGNIERL